MLCQKYLRRLHQRVNSSETVLKSEDNPLVSQSLRVCTGVNVLLNHSLIIHAGENSASNEDPSNLGAT